jgi:hypothetical protein
MCRVEYGIGWIYRQQTKRACSGSVRQSHPECNRASGMPYVLGAIFARNRSSFPSAADYDKAIESYQPTAIAERNDREPRSAQFIACCRGRENARNVIGIDPGAHPARSADKSEIEDMLALKPAANCSCALMNLRLACLLVPHPCDGSTTEDIRLKAARCLISCEPARLFSRPR